MSKKMLLAGVSAIALGAASIPAHADNIVSNDWYTGHFGTASPTPLLSGSLLGGTGVNGPILPNPTKQALALQAPGTAGGDLSAVITLPNGGWLTVTDVEEEGDQFTMSVNGVLATPAVGNPSGLIPGGNQALAGGKTSAPGAASGIFSCNGTGNENITGCLMQAGYSSGTFILPAGVDTITGTRAGIILTGDMDLIVEPRLAVPAPLIGHGFLALLAVGGVLFGGKLLERRKKHHLQPA